MDPVSIGDLARAMMLRRGTAATQAELSSLTADLAAGQASDPARHLQGRVATLLAIDATVGRNGAFARSAAQAAARADATQAALSRIGTALSDSDTALRTAAFGPDPVALRIAAARSQEAFSTAVATLGTRFAGHSLFAGTATDRDAIIPPGELLSAIRSATATAASPAETVTRLRDWFDSPSGFAATAYRGAPESGEVPVAPGETVRFDITATDPAFRAALMGLALGALVADTRFTAEDRADLARRAGEEIGRASARVTDLSGRFGILQARVETAAARLAGESAALGMARNDLLSVDLYEVSSRITQSETRLQTIYALTARLSRLSLVDYL